MAQDPHKLMVTTLIVKCGPNYENKDVNVIHLFKAAEAYHRSQPLQYIWHILGFLKHCARSHGLQATHQDKHKVYFSTTKDRFII